MNTGTPTLDQLHLLTALVEAGSFSAAARRLHRAQSVISYTIANLEAQLGVALFAREGRRPVLTAAGRALIADARRVGRQVDELRARAAALRSGLEAELGLAVDVMFPTARLVAALDDFARDYPTVALRLAHRGTGQRRTARAGRGVPAWGGGLAGEHAGRAGAAGDRRGAADPGGGADASSGARAGRCCA